MNNLEALEALGGLIATLLVILVVILLIFLILRELVTWYWKINQMVGLLEGILAELGALRKGASRKQVSMKEPIVKTSATGQPTSKRLSCDQCGAEIEEGDEFCPECGQKLEKKT